MRTDKPDMAAIQYFANTPANTRTLGFPVLFGGHSAGEVSAELI
jgi:hypothetical protein